MSKIKARFELHFEMELDLKMYSNIQENAEEIMASDFTSLMTSRGDFKGLITRILNQTPQNIDTFNVASEMEGTGERTTDLLLIKREHFLMDDGQTKINSPIYYNLLSHVLKSVVPQRFLYFNPRLGELQEFLGNTEEPPQFTFYDLKRYGLI